MNVGIQTTFLEFFPFISLGKLFADLLRDTTKATLGMGGGLHQSMLGW
jgi:hypothetical protein